MSVLVELKHRNVIHLAGSHFVAAWPIAQGIETLLPMFDVPITKMYGGAKPAEAVSKP